MKQEQKTKLQKIKEDSQAKKVDDLIQSQNSLKDELKSLYKVINGFEPYDATKLINQVRQLTDHLDLKDELKQITESIQANKPIQPENITSVAINNLDNVIKAIENNKPIVNVDLTKIEKAIVQVNQRIEDNTPKESKNPEDYKPFRRVIKLGNRLQYDDQPTPANRSGGGGGGSTTAGLTDAELRATPVPVSMSSDIEIGAVELKNGTDDTRATITAGNALKVDGSAVTQPVSGTVTETNSAAILADTANIDTATAAINAKMVSGTDIGDVTINNTTTTPVPVQPPLSGYLNVSIDQTGNNNAVDVLTMPTITETNSAAIKTAVETIDNAISGSEMQVDVITMPTVTTTESVPTTIYNGKKTVTTAGTRVTLASSTTVKSVTIKALSTNTGFIYVGDTTVASTNGFQLSAGETISMDIANLNTVNLDSSVSGESVTYIGVN